ncbi:S-adenosyl-L-methionine-dependent methyltransferase [Lasiosphaeria ovina]|uniref:S-adenosyl-L-methionine-dependent methyltransferase n=1 Tax=Lasiosphaeria ovina TaxID=92902 RepID=A0AAE0JWW7_9PEZI|nr:S-adenosyl-L-methionine-dependent methyltransferase [Lasiosphaeria ovina]
MAIASSTTNPAAGATPAAPSTSTDQQSQTTPDLSKEYDTPLGLAHTTMQALKDRIKLHYDLASDYYLNLWGEHIHHGYWPTDESKATDSKEVAQLALIKLLLDVSRVADGSRVLDVGCGVGGTSRYLAAELGCAVTGITISSKQVQIATRLTKAAASASASASASSPQQSAASAQPPAADAAAADADGFIRLGKGRVRFVELDAESMGDYFAASSESFDAVWISEALSHFPNKALFFRNAHRLLKAGGKLVLADWFKADGLGHAEFDADIKPIEDGMLLPPLCMQHDYVRLAEEARFEVLAGGPKDISQDVSKTWDISWALVQNPALWAFAFSQGRDGIAFLQAFRAMRRGYANGSFRYAVMAFEKK